MSSDQLFDHIRTKNIGKHSYTSDSQCFSHKRTFYVETHTVIRHSLAYDIRIWCCDYKTVSYEPSVRQ